MVLSKIIDWNHSRDNDNYEPSVEFGMINEELLEYVHSYIKTVNDYVGYDVHNCTEEEYDKEQIVNYIETPQFQEDWKVNQLDALCDIIFVAVGSMGKLLKQDKSMVLLALDAVIEANEAKGREVDENGKIIKPEGFVGPEEKLRGIIKEVYGG